MERTDSALVFAILAMATRSQYGAKDDARAAVQSMRGAQSASMTDALLDAAEAESGIHVFGAQQRAPMWNTTSSK